MSAEVHRGSLPARPLPQEAASRARAWLAPALATNALWGAWGAWADAPARAGFPPTLGFVAWVATLVPVVSWLRRGSPPLRRDRRALVLGLCGGLPAGAGNLLLFEALARAPAHVVFPLVSLYPLIAVVLGVAVLRETLSGLGVAGVIAALVAVPLLALPGGGAEGATTLVGLLLAGAIALLWGLQGFVWKLAEPVLRSDELCAYLLVSSLLVAPGALWLTNWSTPVNWGVAGLGLALVVQSLNSVGLLSYARAMRAGPSVVVVPLTALAPLVTVLLSLMHERALPSPLVAAGIALATLATVLLARS